MVKSIAFDSRTEKKKTLKRDGARVKKMAWNYLGYIPVGLDLSKPIDTQISTSFLSVSLPALVQARQTGKTQKEVEEGGGGASLGLWVEYDYHCPSTKRERMRIEGALENHFRFNPHPILFKRGGEPSTSCLLLDRQVTVNTHKIVTFILTGGISLFRTTFLHCTVPNLFLFSMHSTFSKISPKLESLSLSHSLKPSLSHTHTSWS